MASKISDIRFISDVTLPITSQDVDLELLEFIYVCKMGDILNNSELLGIILSSGYYKAAFCEAFEMEQGIITHNGVEHVLRAVPKDQPSIYDTVTGTTKRGPKFLGKLKNSNI